MSIMMVLIIAAALCAVASLVLGIAAMTSHGQVAHRTSSQWMTMRVTFQAIAIALVLLAIWV